MKVLIIEDDKSLARLLQQAVSEAGYSTQVEQDGNIALIVAHGPEFDLILLDVMLPGMDGLEICRQLRADRIYTPVLMITSKDSIDNKVEGLDAGADDYIVKPIAIKELVARMRALLRRGNAPATLLYVANLTLDTASRRASRGGKTILLSSTEYSLLEYLMRNEGQVLTRVMILDHVWQYDFDGNDNVLDVYIGYLRRKIDIRGEIALIRTVRGVGFCIEVLHEN